MRIATDKRKNMHRELYEEITGTSHVLLTKYSEFLDRCYKYCTDSKLQT